MEKQKLLKNLKCRGSLLALLLTLVASLFTYNSAWAGAGFWDEGTFSITFKGSSTETFSGNKTGVETKDLGTVTSLSIDKWQAMTWKDNSGNICDDTYINYKFSATGTEYKEKGSVKWNDPSQNNNKFYKDGSTIVLVDANTAPGDYTVEIWFTAKGNENGGGCEGTMYASNDSKNYKVTYTVPNPAPSGDAPTVLIADAPSVSGSVGTLFGYLKFTGCQNVTDFGFVWSTDEAVIRDTPSDGTQATATSPEKPIASGSYGTDFQAADVEFTPQNTIYYKAYATNSVGTSYSDEYRSFQTSGCIKPVVTGITVPAQICSNAGTIKATATAIDGVTYAWSVDGTVFTKAEGTTNTATITVGAAGIGSITVTPTRTSDACVGDPYPLNNVEVVEMPLADPEITGEDAVCPNAESVTYTVDADGATTYAWTVTGTGWSITSGAATSTVTVKPGTEAGTLSVTVSNSCRNKSADKTITLKPMPQTPGTISGDATVCRKSDKTYSIEAVAGATGYEWVVPTGWTMTGEGTSITATPGVDAVDGDIKVLSVNDCGKSEYSTLAVEVKGYNITLADQGYITTPWDIFTLNATTDADASLVSWTCVYSGTLSDETLTVFETNGKTAKLKSGAPVSDTEKYTIKAKTTDGDCVVESNGYDVYVNAAAAEMCN